MINDPLIVLKDRIWWEATKDLEDDKAGELRNLHIQLFDEVKTEKECNDIKALALAEANRVKLIPKPATIEERLTALENKTEDPSKN